MRLILQIKNDGACGAASEDIGDPFADAAGVVEDVPGLAARMGVTQAEARRRMYRLFVAVEAAAVDAPPAREAVPKSAAETDAELKKERGEKAEAEPADAELNMEAKAEAKLK